MALHAIAPVPLCVLRRGVKRIVSADDLGVEPASGTYGEPGSTQPHALALETIAPAMLSGIARNIPDDAIVAAKAIVMRVVWCRHGTFPGARNSTEEQSPAFPT